MAILWFYDKLTWFGEVAIRVHSSYTYKNMKINAGYLQYDYKHSIKTNVTVKSIIFISVRAKTKRGYLLLLTCVVKIADLLKTVIIILYLKGVVDIKGY